MNVDDILNALAAREPIFHRPHFARTLEDFARLMSPNYWEIGASGKRYDRAFILEHLAANPPADAGAAGWLCTNFHLLSLAAHTFLLTYNLNQNGRETRRATIWTRNGAGWQILYHQGTLIAAA
jgi:hypothetical protein